ncbi:MAG: hypothetical protein ACTHU0_27935 [Kofleriaceae bacterium]
MVYYVVRANGAQLLRGVLLETPQLVPIALACGTLGGSVALEQLVFETEHKKSLAVLKHLGQWACQLNDYHRLKLDVTVGSCLEEDFRVLDILAETEVTP